MSASADFAGTYLSGDSVVVRSRYVRSTPTEVPTGGGICAFVCLSSHLGGPFKAVGEGVTEGLLMRDAFD